MQLLSSARETIATIVKYKCKTFITLTPDFVDQAIAELLANDRVEELSSPSVILKIR